MKFLIVYTLLYEKLKRNPDISDMINYMVYNNIDYDIERLTTFMDIFNSDILDDIMNSCNCVMKMENQKISEIVFKHDKNIESNEFEIILAGSESNY